MNSGERVDRGHLRVLEALLFASAEPIDLAAMQSRLPSDADVRALLSVLQAEYRDRGVNLVRVGQKWAFRTATDLARVLNLERPLPRRLSRAALETLAIIAYHQPITRAEIDELRGVQLSRGTLELLLELGWIKPGRRRESPGRPVTWLTTDAFLDHFGLEGLDALPGIDELKAAGLLDAQLSLAVSMTQDERRTAEGGEDAAAHTAADDDREGPDQEEEAAAAER